MRKKRRVDTPEERELRDKILNEIIGTGLLETCVDCQLSRRRSFNCNWNNRDDIVQDAYLWLLTYDIDKLRNAYEGNHINALITGYLTRQILSTSSKYYNTYLKFDRLCDEVDEVMKETFDDEDPKHRLR